MTNKRLADTGQYESFRDQSGRSIINLAGGFGLQVPQVIEQVYGQAESMGLSNRVLLSEPLIRLCRTVADMLPDSLSTSYVCSSGDEAFEGALKLCKGLHPNRRSIAYLTGGDYGCLSYGRILNNPAENAEIMRFLGINLKPISSTADLQRLDLSHCFAFCHPYVYQGSGGRFAVSPAPLLSEAYALTSKYGVPTIGYDVDTCLGLLGTMFGFQKARLTPDILVIGGGLSGGAIPIGMYVCPESMAYKVYGRSTPAKHGSTTAGNPMSCVAALAALEHAQVIDAPKHCEQNGLALAATLSSLSARPVGGFVAVPLPSNTDRAALRGHLYRAGVFVSHLQGSDLVLRPPVCSRRDNLLQAAERIMEVMTNEVTNAA
ncbi:MAG: aminotransferase class III-fold pyridoxal phosphate-dependent enzyme [Marinobacter sp.]|uniref:aminotransferase class III-fold pyridoxal phosphate-dependent enzyme n=1 Tax=Marinobacter sp. AC-23 TaxID=1879031 RepID=UPI0008DE4EC9|nr:aminotransferase class III-fold pyridoxal phosphate-dependent enzyme [Marinobacter sp. AC-23]OHY80021.1 acetylornithine aminotransferase [Marinobacter sp. AC-23]